MDEIIRLTEQLHDILEMSQSSGVAAASTSNVTTNVTNTGTSASPQMVTVPAPEPVDISTIEDRLTELTGFVRQISTSLK